MQLFRKPCIRLSLSFIAGVLFLNMGLVVLELRLLKLDQVPEMSINISALLASATAEEERDGSTASPNFADEDYLQGHSGSITRALLLIPRMKAHQFDDGASRQGYLKKFLPPPENSDPQAD